MEKDKINCWSGNGGFNGNQVYNQVDSRLAQLMIPTNSYSLKWIKVGLPCRVRVTMGHIDLWNKWAECPPTPPLTAPSNQVHGTSYDKQVERHVPGTNNASLAQSSQHDVRPAPILYFLVVMGRVRWWWWWLCHCNYSRRFCQCS